MTDKPSGYCARIAQFTSERPIATAVFGPNEGTVLLLQERPKQIGVVHLGENKAHALVDTNAITMSLSADRNTLALSAIGVISIVSLNDFRTIIDYAMRGKWRYYAEFFRDSANLIVSELGSRNLILLLSGHLLETGFFVENVKQASSEKLYIGKLSANSLTINNVDSMERLLTLNFDKDAEYHVIDATETHLGVILSNGTVWIHNLNSGKRWQLDVKAGDQPYLLYFIPGKSAILVACEGDLSIRIYNYLTGARECKFYHELDHVNGVDYDERINKLLILTLNHYFTQYQFDVYDLNFE